MPIVETLMARANGKLTVQKSKVKVAIALGKKIPESPGRFIAYLFSLVGIPSQLWGEDRDKVKIPTGQWEALMENDLLSRLDTAISHRFSHLCRQLQEGNLQAILAPCSKNLSSPLKPRQGRAEENVKNSLMSLGNLGQIVQCSDSVMPQARFAPAPELLKEDVEPVTLEEVSDETLEIDAELNDYDLHNPLEALTGANIATDSLSTDSEDYRVHSGQMIFLSSSNKLVK